MIHLSFLTEGDAWVRTPLNDTRGIPDASLIFGVTASYSALVYFPISATLCRYDTRLCTFMDQ